MKNKFLLLAMSMFMLWSCTSIDEMERHPELIYPIITTELPGDNCEAGGIKLISLIDGEESTEYVCHGLNGKSVIIEIEEAGDNCTEGGFKLISEINGSIVVDYLCNGENGIDGLNGIDGVDGINGKDGNMIIMSIEEPGDNCSAGGLKFTTIVNGELVSGYTCNGIDGLNGLDGIDGLDGINGINGKDGNMIIMSIEEPGDNCSAGGLKFTTIVNGELVSGYTCNGIDGLNGLDGIDGLDGINGINGKDGSLIIMSVEEPGENCSTGGVKFTTIVDGVLVSTYACNGSDGEQGPQGTAGINGKDGNMIIMSVEEPGDNCSTGGVKFTTTVDGELVSHYACNGSAGIDGLDGLDGVDGINGIDGNTVWVVVEEPGENCEIGGLRVLTAFNGRVFSMYICNGLDGADGVDGIDGLDGIDGIDGEDGNIILMSIEEPGENCSAGGVKFTTTVDGVLVSTYACNGSDGEQGPQGTAGINGKDGNMIIMSVEEPGDNCSAGGVKFTTTVDGVLVSTYACNGSNGLDGLNGLDGSNGLNGIDGINGENGNLIIMSVEEPGDNCSAGGVKFTTTVDGVLVSTYACNGSNGLDGINGTNGTNGLNGLDGANGLDGNIIIMSVEEPGENCSTGGVKFTTTVDGVLVSTYACNGEDGLDGLNGIDGVNGLNGINGINGVDGTIIVISIEEPGDNCTEGGIKFTTTVAGNLVSYYVCNGSNGVDGLNGLNGIDGLAGLDGLDGTSVVVIKEYPGDNCSTGGVKVISQLNGEPVINYICNGDNGCAIFGIGEFTIDFEDGDGPNNSALVPGDDLVKFLYPRDGCEGIIETASCANGKSYDAKIVSTSSSGNAVEINSSTGGFIVFDFRKYNTISNGNNNMGKVNVMSFEINISVPGTYYIEGYDMDGNYRLQQISMQTGFQRVDLAWANMTSISIAGSNSFQIDNLSLACGSIVNTCGL